jgi:valyl-tRNA synthetase
MVRHLALLGKVPYRTILINGMVVGDDGRKMSKSLGNYVDTTYARSKWGADALRQWAVIAASTGSDVPFNWKDVEFGHRFMRKFWNAARFASPHLENASELRLEKVQLRPTDRWILSRYNRLVKEVTEHLENFEFNHALRKIHTFVWHELCDMYIEEVKHRLYENSRDADGVRATLYRVVLGCVQMLAPFIPHFAEEVFHRIFKREKVFESVLSVHQTSWPSPEDRWISEKHERIGQLLNTIIASVRQLKAKRRLPLVHPIDELGIYVADLALKKNIEEARPDICGTLKIKKFIFLDSPPATKQRIRAIRLNYSSAGPKYRRDLEKIELALQNIEPDRVFASLREGKLKLTVGEKTVELEPEDLIIERETAAIDENVEIIEPAGVPITMIVRLASTQK